MKKRLFGIILCVSLLLSSMSVFAGSATKYFNGNVAYLNAGNGQIYATTDVSESGTVTTQARAYSSYGDNPLYTSRTNYIGIPVPAGCTGAESYHYVGSSSAYLTTSYN